MAITTITGLIGVTITDLTDAAVFAVDDANVATRKATLAQVRTRLGTTNSATAWSIGPNGTTNPVWQIDCSTGSQAAGLLLTGATSAGTVALQVISSGANANLSIYGKGSGTVTVEDVVFSAGTVNGTTYQISSVTALSRSGDYTDVTDGDGVAVTRFGDATDPTNYYDNATHAWRARSAGSTLATLTIAGLTVTGDVTASGGDVFVTSAAGVPRALLTATTGTNAAYFQATTTGGSYFFGSESSTSSVFGATAYAQVIFAPAGRNIEFFPAAGKTLTLASALATFATAITATSTSANQLQLLYDGSNHVTIGVDSGGTVTLNATGASAAFAFSDAVTVTSTVTNQLKLQYDGSNHLTIGVDSGGTVTYNATGASAIHGFSDAITVTSTVTNQLKLLYDGSNHLTIGVDSAGAITYNATGASAGHTFSESVTVATGGIAVTGNSTITGTLGGLTTVTASGLGTFGSLTLGNATISKIFTGTKTHDFASLAPGAFESTGSFTVTGAEPGDVVLVELPVGITGGLVLTGIVTSSNNVAIGCVNASSGTIDQGSMTMRVVVFRVS